MCTSGRKYGLNTYVGCSHGCLYCYTQVFPGMQKNKEPKPRTRMLEKLAREARKKERLPVYISPLTDPHQPIEREYRITRKAIEILSDFPLILTTKSSLVLDDLDLLKKRYAVVSFSLLTLDKRKARRIEPNAPPPQKILEAMEELEQNRIPTTLRLQPIIPGFNDREEELETLIKECSYRGVKHVTAGTLKLTKPGLERIRNSLKKLADRLEVIYFKNPDKRWHYYYAPKELRLELMKSVAKLCKKYKLTFGSCREGCEQLNTSSCDAQALAEKLYHSKHLTLEQYE